MNEPINSKNNLNISAVIFFVMTLLISGGVYLYTLAPTVTFGDSGDFITAAYALRFAHPPGYPVFIILGKLFSLLPISGEIAYRINFMSAFFSTLSVGMVYILVLFLVSGGKSIFKKQNNGPLSENQEILNPGIHACAMLGALSFAFSGTFWSQALVAKVHPLAAFLTAVVFLLILKYGWTGERKFWFASVFIWGFSLGTHFTPVLYILPVLLFLWYEKKLKDILSGSSLIYGVSLALLGFSVNLMIPLVSPHLIEVEWGLGDSWQGFKHILLRGDYAPYEWARPFSALAEQISTAAGTLITGQSTSLLGLLYGLIITCMGLLGILWLIKNRRGELALLAGAAFMVWGFYIANSNHPMTRQLSLETRDIFFIPAYMIFGIWVGLGLVGIYQKKFLEGESPTGNNKTGVIIWMIVIIFLSCLGFSIQIQRHNEREYFLAKDYARCLMDTMEKDAIYIGDDDMHLFPLWYLQQVEGYRTDILIFSRTSFYKQWYYDNLKKRNLPQFQLPAFSEGMVPKDILKAQAFLDKQLFALFTLNLAERPCYFYQKYPLKITPPLPVSQVGLLYRVTQNPLKGSIQAEPYPYLPPANSYQYQLGLQPLGERDFWRNWAIERLSDYHDLEGQYWMGQMNLIRAEAELLQAVDLNPFNARGHFDLGEYYLTQGEFEKARDSYARALYINPDMEKARVAIDKLKIR